MMASRPFDAMRGVGRNALDLPVAALAGVAVAFLAFAMPADLLNQLVEGSGLPGLLSAAEPPLGLKARAGVGLAGAFAVFGLVFILLRLLDRTGYDMPRPAKAAAPEEQLPRLRRRDAHPDAPDCRPISAARDFGEPAPPVAPVAPVAPPPPVAEPSPHAARPEGKRILDVLVPDEEVEQQPQPEVLVAAEPVIEPVAAPEPMPEPQVEVEPASVAAAPVQVPTPPQSGVSEVERAEADLTELMARLEQGLARRRADAAAPADTSAPQPQVFPEAADDRLQSAIDSLQRLAQRHS
jgi:hypothetical protein